MRTLTRTQNFLLTVGATLGTLCLLTALAGILLGAKPLIFRSGSMEPAIATGSLALSLPVDATSIRPGDVVSVTNAAGVRITHRVLDSVPAGDSARLKLKGDANTVADTEPYTVTAADKVVFSAPLLGYGVSWLSSPAATFLAGIVTAYLLYVSFRYGRGQKSRGGRRAVPSPPAPPPPPAEGGRPRASGGRPRASGGRRSKGARGVAGLTVLALAGTTSVALTHAPEARAAFTDAENMATATFTAATLPAPTLGCTQNTVLLLPDNSTVDLAWSHNNGSTGATGYRFTTQTGNGPESSPIELGAATTARSVTANETSSAVQVVVTFRIYSKYQLWRSPLASSTARYTPSALGGLIPATLTC
ncbi:signal peptidase I [Arthrobacter sp. ZGTC131]|uniref:signal peptidase I n=1 Tax=Arthrobacter sp. ZGTC131 TaxID=2058898 RepID=UPI000CE52CEF|nr:signal peptidase I [Arthrobacter sp. ZGTC131]